MTTTSTQTNNLPHYLGLQFIKICWYFLRKKRRREIRYILSHMLGLAQIWANRLLKNEEKLETTRGTKFSKTTRGTNFDNPHRRGFFKSNPVCSSVQKQTPTSNLHRRHPYLCPRGRWWAPSKYKPCTLPPRPSSSTM